MSPVAGIDPRPWPELVCPMDVAEVLGGALPIIDVRSEGEYAVDHPPGAHSIPLLDDVQRRLVGTLYNRHSPKRAREAGRDLIRGRIARLVHDIAGALALGVSFDVARIGELFEAISGRLIERPTEAVGPLPEPPPVLSIAPFAVMCWRGGERSRAVVALLRSLGLPARQLAGGYKAYRRFLMDALEQLELPPLCVIHGLTGVGKTRLLSEIEALAPGRTIDLEGLAGHRSSLLGHLGLQPVSQKRFESRLWARLRRLDPGTVVFIEGESRTIGHIGLPPRLWQAMSAGTHVLAEASMAVRRDRLLEEYPSEVDAAMLEALTEIARRLGKRQGGELLRLAGQGALGPMVELLLEAYYDPRYRHSSRGVSWSHQLDLTCLPEAAATLLALIDSATPAPQER